MIVAFLAVVLRFFVRLRSRPDEPKAEGETIMWIHDPD